jgi:DNA-binding transcriptional MocR family regulator
MPEIAGGRGPIYVAIADALAEDIAAGKLPPRTRLPTHRELAYRLGVTVGTVTRGYAVAERRGLVYGETGRGTFVLAGPPDPTLSVQAEAGERIDTPINFAIDLTINFAIGEQRDQSMARTLTALGRRNELRRFLNYHPHRGMAEHRAAAAEWLNRNGLSYGADQVLVTGGGQHAMMTVFSTLCRPGDVVLAEQLTYAGMKALANHLQIRLHGIAMDQHGLIPSALAAACRSTHARVLYCQPTIQNPTATIMPEARRREIIEVARAHNVTIVDDDVYGFQPEKNAPPLAALAPDITGYITSASKTMAPGLRIGYVGAPLRLAERLGLPVRATLWMAPPLMAEIARQWMEDGTVERIIDELRRESGERQDMARRILATPEARMCDGSFLVWLPLPRDWRARDFVAEAARRGVAISGSDSFAVDPLPAPESVRICLGAPASRAHLERGLEILRELLVGPAGPSLSVV